MSILSLTNPIIPLIQDGERLSGYTGLSLGNLNRPLLQLHANDVELVNDYKEFSVVLTNRVIAIQNGSVGVNLQTTISIQDSVTGASNYFTNHLYDIGALSNDSSAEIHWANIFPKPDHNALPSSQGGAAGQEYHLTLQNYDRLVTNAGQVGGFAILDSNGTVNVSSLPPHNTFILKQGGNGADEFYHMNASSYNAVTTNLNSALGGTLLDLASILAPSRLPNHNLWSGLSGGGVGNFYHVSAFAYVAAENAGGPNGFALLDSSGMFEPPVSHNQLEGLQGGFEEYVTELVSIFNPNTLLPEVVSVQTLIQNIHHLSEEQHGIFLNEGSAGGVTVLNSSGSIDGTKIKNLSYIAGLTTLDAIETMSNIGSIEVKNLELYTNSNSPYGATISLINYLPYEFFVNPDFLPDVRRPIGSIVEYPIGYSGVALPVSISLIAEAQLLDLPTHTQLDGVLPVLPGFEAGWNSLDPYDFPDMADLFVLTGRHLFFTLNPVTMEKYILFRGVTSFYSPIMYFSGFWRHLGNEQYYVSGSQSNQIIAVDSSTGDVYVGVTVSSLPPKIFKLVAGVWTSLPDILPGYLGDLYDMKVDPQSGAVVLLLSDAYLYQYDGVSWTTLNSSALHASGDIDNGTFEFHPITNLIHVVFHKQVSFDESYRIDNPSSKTALGSPLAKWRSVIKYHPVSNELYRLVTAANGLGGPLSLYRFDGSSWVAVGSTNFTDTVLDEVDFTFHPITHDPYVVCVETDKCSVYTYDGVSWTKFGDSFLTANAPHNPYIFFEDGSTLPSVICMDTVNNVVAEYVYSDVITDDAYKVQAWPDNTKKYFMRIG